MLKKLLLRIFLLAPLIFFNSVSCIDSDYDLSDIDTDEIAIGDEIVVKLGTGVISADKLLDIDQISEISADPATGIYAARYFDFMPIEINPADIPEPQVEEVLIFAEIKGSGAVQPPYSGAIANDAVFKVPSVSEPVKLETGREGEKIEKIIFSPGNYPEVVITFDFDKFAAAGPQDNQMQLEISFPQGYSFAGSPSVPTGSGSAVISPMNVLTYTSPLSYYGQRRITLLLAGAELNDGDEIKLEGEIKVKAGSNVVLGERTSPTEYALPYIDVAAAFELGRNYEIIYGQFNVSFDTPSPNPIDVSGLNSIFIGEDDLLSFINPCLVLDAETTFGISLDVEMDVKAHGHDGRELTGILINGINLEAADNTFPSKVNKIWVGSDPSIVQPGYEFVENDGLSDLFKDAPYYLTFETRAETVHDGQTMFFSPYSYMKVKYQVVVPLAPAPDFRATIEQVMNDVFSEDLIEYMFSSGTAELYGNVYNGFPLDLDLSIIVTDEEGSDLGMVFDKQIIKACTSVTRASSNPVSFKFTESHMALMENAKDIVLHFNAKGTNSGIAISEYQELVLDLKISKTGGIIIRD